MAIISRKIGEPDRWGDVWYVTLVPQKKRILLTTFDKAKKRIKEYDGFNRGEAINFLVGAFSMDTRIVDRAMAIFDDIFACGKGNKVVLIKRKKEDKWTLASGRF